MSTIHLVYAHENQNLAEQLTQQIGRIGIPFQHFTDHADMAPGQLAARVQASEGPVLLLITDNFLKNRLCMANALALFQTLAGQNRLLTVVADGRQPNAEGQGFEPVPTQFDRVVHAIQYMNFWQTAYLDLNSKIGEVSAAEKETFERELEAVRNIANEIGELFSTLKEAKYYSWEQLEADDYALFFRHFNLQEWHAQYKKLAALDKEAPAPVLTREHQTAPVSETPVFSGPLAPASASIPEPTYSEPNGVEHIQEKTPPQESVESVQPASDTAGTSHEDSERRQRLIEKEIRQTILDAGFWLERGYTERGLELFRVALEQYPEHEDLQNAYRDALEQYTDTGNGVEPEPLAPAETVAAEPTETQEPVTEEPTPAAPDQAREAASYEQMGDNALEKGDYLLAKYCWDRVTELTPDVPGIFRKLALLTSTYLPDYKETAAHYLEQALNSDPGDADLHYRLAVLQRDHLDQPDKALQHFRDTVALNANYGAAWLALAQHSLDNGDADQAESFYRQAIEVDAKLRSDELDARFIIQQPEKTNTRTTDVEPVEEPAVQTEAQTAQAPAAGPEAVSGPEPLTVLITGATSGIGQATAERFARAGHRLILTGRRTERLHTLQTQLQESFQNECITLNLDVRDPGATEAALDSLPEAWQEIDLLINNAGLAKGLAPIHEGDPGHWDAMIDTNVKGLLYMTRLIAPGMVKRRKGHIINVGSIAGKEVYYQGNVYCASKFAVDALTKSMRLDLHSHNVRVSQVSPGHVEETEFALTRFDGDEARAKIYNDFQPLKAADVAETIYFIATQPPHVNILDVVMTGTQQANATVIDRSGR